MNFHVGSHLGLEAVVASILRLEDRGNGKQKAGICPKAPRW